MSIYDNGVSESTAKQAVANFISTHSANYTVGIAESGLTKGIVGISTSASTPPTGYYYIHIGSGPVEVRPIEGTDRTLRVPKYGAFYTIEINITDFAMIQPTDSNPFDTMDNNIKLVGDRIINSLLSVSDITYNGHKFCLRGAEITPEFTKTHFGSTWAEVEQGNILLFTQIQFQIMQRITV